MIMHINSTSKYANTYEYAIYISNSTINTLYIFTVLVNMMTLGGESPMYDIYLPMYDVYQAGNMNFTCLCMTYV